MKGGSSYEEVSIYSTADVMYAKLIKRRIKNDKRFSKDQTEQ